MCLSHISRVLLRKQHLDLWQMKTEFLQTFMVAMSGGKTPHLNFASSGKLTLSQLCTN